MQQVEWAELNANAVYYKSVNRQFFLYIKSDFTVYTEIGKHKLYLDNRSINTVCFHSSHKVWNLCANYRP